MRIAELKIFQKIRPLHFNFFSTSLPSKHKFLKPLLGAPFDLLQHNRPSIFQIFKPILFEFLNIFFTFHPSSALYMSTSSQHYCPLNINFLSVFFFGAPFVLLQHHRPSIFEIFKKMLLEILNYFFF